MSVVAIGDNVVDCYLSTGEMFPGGNCVNVAVAAARAGVPSAYVGALGSDMAGELLRLAMSGEGVDLTHARKVEGPNAFTTVELVDGDRRFGRGDPGVRTFVPSASELAFVSRFDVAHSSYCSGLEDELGRIAANVRLSFDFDDRIGSAYAEALLAHCWIACFSGAHLDDTEIEEAARWAYVRGPQYVLLTRGSRGAVLYDGATLHLQAPHPTDIVDTLGAGDSFIGRMLVGLTSGEAIAELLDAAAAAASATCGLPGGFGHAAAIPDGYA
ncbi:MAG: PfkB family carbohydrate kinase [Candidatus Nanopelagicales bacterium]